LTSAHWQSFSNALARFLEAELPDQVRAAQDDDVPLPRGCSVVTPSTGENAVD